LPQTQTYRKRLLLLLLLLLLLAVVAVVYSLSYLYIQAIYNYIPETNHIYRVHGVAAIMYLQYILHVMSM